MVDELKKEEGNPSRVHAVKVLKKDKLAAHGFAVVKEELVVKNGKSLKILRLANGNTKRLYLGKSKKK